MGIENKILSNDIEMKKCQKKNDSLDMGIPRLDCCEESRDKLIENGCRRPRTN